jgi:Na+/melibiose symporter-like transporter
MADNSQGTATAGAATTAADGTKSPGLNSANWKEVLGFSFNNASTNAVFLLISTYFLVYCTEVYGFSALLVGSLMTATRLFDAVTDPIIGVFIDRTDTKYGRFRPWIAGGAVLSAVMIVLMFSGIRTGSATGDLVLVIALYVVWVFGYTAQTACTKSAQNVLTNVPKQRSTVNALGMIGTILVYMIALAGVVPLLGMRGGMASPGAWRFVAIIFGGIQLVFAVFVVLGLQRKDVASNYQKLTQREQPSFRDYIRVFRSNRALQMLIVAASTNKITQTMQAGVTVLFYFYVAQNQTLQSTVSIVTLPIMVLSMVAMIRLIERYGRKETFTFASWGGMLFGIAAIFLVPINPGSMIWLVAVMGVNLILIAGASDVNVISMIGDSADYEYYTNNQFIPGMIGTAFSFIDKIISSFGTLIIGAILTGIGFVSITETPFSQTIFWTVLAMYFGLPAIGHLFSIIAMRFYPLDKRTHTEMLEALAERDAAAAVAGGTD